MSDHDRALRAAAEALRAADWDEVEEPDELAKVAIAAYVDSLLEGLPEEAVEAIALAMRNDFSHDGSDLDLAVDEDAEYALKQALRSLRTGLEGGTE